MWLRLPSNVVKVCLINENISVYVVKQSSKKDESDHSAQYQSKNR